MIELLSINNYNFFIFTPVQLKQTCTNYLWKKEKNHQWNQMWKQFEVAAYSYYTNFFLFLNSFYSSEDAFDYTES